MLQSFVFNNVGHYVLHVTASNEFGSANNSIALVNMSFYLFLCSLSVSVFTYSMVIFLLTVFITISAVV